MEITEIASGLRFPEGPVWMPDGTLLCVELKGRTVVRVHLDGRVETVATPGGSPNGLAIGPDGAAYVCNSGGWGFSEIMGMTVPDLRQPGDYSGGRIERVDLDTGQVTVLYTECDGNELVGPNDLVFDAAGGMWFTDHGKQRGRMHTLGAVYYAAADGSEIREAIFPLDSPNGIGLSPEGDRLYVAETHTGRVFWWAIEAPGVLAAGGPVGHGGTLLAGLPGMQLLDSLGVDGAGNVVVGTIVNGGLTVIAPDADGSGINGVEHIPLPDLFVTNVCFGGPDLSTAYATLSGIGKIVALPWPRPGLALEF